MKTRSIVVLSLALGGAIVLAVVADYRKHRAQKALAAAVEPTPAPAPTISSLSAARPTQMPSDLLTGARRLEQKARMAARTAIDLDGYKPAIIFSRLRGASEEFYACLGSVKTIGDKSKVLTAFHLFYLPGERSYRVEVLGEPNTKPMYIQGDGIDIRDPQKDGADMVLAFLGPDEHLFRNQGTPPVTEVVNYAWDIPTIGGSRIDRVTSGIAGITYHTVGWALNKETRANYLIIEASGMEQGDSGMLFVDTDKRFWILHAGPDDGQVGYQMRMDYRKNRGRDLNGAIMLSGPFIVEKR